MSREGVVWLAVACVLFFAGRATVRAVLGEPPPAGPPGDERAPGEPEPPGIGASGAPSRAVASPLVQPGEPRELEVQESWEARYFPPIPYEPEVERASLIKGRRLAGKSPAGVADMVVIPAGEAPLGDDALRGARPQRQVRVAAFRIDKTEVTMAAFAAYVSAERAQAPFAPDPWAAPYRFVGNEPPPGHHDHPVVLVTRDEARSYCGHLGKRLPTEEEWERAARGDRGGRYPWGNRWDSLKTNVVTRLSGPLRRASEWEAFAASFAGDRIETAAVGTHPEDASPFGVLDMAGNVSEWVEGTFGAPEGADPADHPAFGRNFAVVRGNAWGNRDYSAPLAVRYPYEAARKDIMIGFRCAASL